MDIKFHDISKYEYYSQQLEDSLESFEFQIYIDSLNYRYKINQMQTISYPFQPNSIIIEAYIPQKFNKIKVQIIYIGTRFQ